ncbi:hypothetical protein GE09DRAFT_653656 [Coniochaeta sp. 2T2.1]|nr:hypothetical protein GE09DRAFT_653656 [Coniochaeta sp. 2T2.1]
MGLLSFLSRKSTSDRPSHETLLITQAYHSTTARVPPLKGEYPIGGNGPRNLEALTKYHGLGPSQLRLEDISLPGEEPAPAPVVPTFRNDGADRPTSAPNAKPLTANWANTSRLRKSNLGDQRALSTSKSERQSLRAGYASSSGNRTSSIVSSHADGPQPRPYTAHQQSNPATSVIGMGYKDLLDAQSELKPLNFRSRIKASGARDYGEDVADRNIGENGHNLELPQVQAFYAQSTDSESPRKPKPVSTANMSRPYRRDASQQSLISKSATVESRVRTKSLNSSNTQTYQHQRASFVPELPPPTTTAAQNSEQRPRTSDAVTSRQSRNIDPRGDTEPGIQREGPKARRLTYRHGPPLPLSPLRNSLDMGVEGMDSASFGQHLGPPVSKHAESSGTLKPEKDTTILTKGDNQPAVKDHAKPDEHAGSTRPPSSQRAFPLAPSKPSTRRHSTAAASVTSAHRTYAHSMKPSIASSVASYHTAIDTTTFSSSPHRQADFAKTRNRMSLPIHSPSHHQPQADTFETAPSPTIRTTTTRRDPHNRNKSQPTTTLHFTTDDLPEPPPPRTSSLRNWSISSATPTTSDTSSNAFFRPQSRANTATTSVDLGKDFVIELPQPSSLPNPPHPNPDPNLSIPEPNLLTPLSSPPFSIDDYLSADPDSSGCDSDSLEPRLPGGAGEEDLLFSLSGYGAFQLPGLSDTLASTPPAQAVAMFDVHDAVLPIRPMSSASLPQFGQQPVRRRYVLDTAADSDSDWDDEEEVRSWAGGDGGYGFPGSGLRHTRRLSAIGSHTTRGQDVIVEEREGGKVDVAAAVRQRKEEKARKRGLGGVGDASRRRMKGKGKGMESERIVGGGHEGDVEC